MAACGAVTGVVWTEEEWSALARAFAKDEAERPEDTPVQRWSRLVPQTFSEGRQRPLPKGPLEERAAKLFKLLPAARAQFKVEQEQEAARQQAQEAARLEAQRQERLAEEAAQEGTSGTASSRLSLVSSSVAKEKPNKIFWTLKEKRGFADLYAMLEIVEPKLGIAERVERTQDEMVAQKLLAPDRRRRGQAAAILSGTMAEDLLPEARKRAKEAQDLAERKRWEAELLSQSSMTPAAAPAAAQPAISFAGQPLFEALKTAMVGLLTEVLADPSVRQAIQQAVAPSAPAPSLPPVPMAVATLRPAMPKAAPKAKILIVGLLSNQQRDVAAAFNDKYDLRFLTQDDSSTRLEQHAKACDKTIGMVGFMSHPTEKILKTHSPDYHPVSGTVSELKRVLTGWLNS